MICRPCRDDEHIDCPDIEGRLWLVRERGLGPIYLTGPTEPPGDEVTELPREGNWCDCQHKERGTALVVTPGT